MDIFLIMASLLLLAGLIYGRSKRAKKKVVCVTEDTCTGCQGCIRRCPHQVLEIRKNETGSYVMVKNPEKCTACGHCVTACKFNILSLVNRGQPV